MVVSAKNLCPLILEGCLSKRASLPEGPLCYNLPTRLSHWIGQAWLELRSFLSGDPPGSAGTGPSGSASGLLRNFQEQLGRIRSSSGCKMLLGWRPAFESEAAPVEETRRQLRHVHCLPSHYILEVNVCASV